MWLKYVSQWKGFDGKSKYLPERSLVGEGEGLPSIWQFWSVENHEKNEYRKTNTKKCFPFHPILICAWVDLHYWRIRQTLYACFLKKNCYILIWFSISYVSFSLASWSQLFVSRPFLSSYPLITFVCVGLFQPHLTRRHRCEAWGPMQSAWYYFRHA